MKKSVVIIDYGMGNVGSVKNALTFLGQEAIISSQPKDLEEAHRLILPGVGAFADGMKNLAESGFLPSLESEVLTKKKPILGLCLGMQLFAEEGEEGGLNKGLGWIKGRVRKFSVDEIKLKVPHVGWNDIYPREDSLLFCGVKRPIFYFVHSYHLVPEDRGIVAAESEYGERFVAAIEKDNIFGLQFHPEKSQQEGLRVLENFLNYHFDF